jgi:hypothetical protein
MASIIPLLLGPAGLARPGSRAGGPWAGVAGRLVAALAAASQRERALRELRRLDDWQLRDIRLERKDIGGPPRASVAWDAGPGTRLVLGKPRP